MSADREISANSDRRYLGGTNQGSPTFPGRASFRTNPAVTGSNTASILINPSEDNPTVADYRTYDPNADAFNFRTTTIAIPAMEKYQYYVRAATRSLATRCRSTATSCIPSASSSMASLRRPSLSA